MALEWKWQDKIGYITIVEEYENKATVHNLSLYEGNALLIMLDEKEEDKTWMMAGFFLDKDHAKNCLGLSKNSYNIYNNANRAITCIEIDTSKSKHYKEFLPLFIKAFSSLEIHLYSTSPW